MKKIILISIVLFNIKSSNAQVPDTLAYLKSIVTKKSFYIGKPFSVLRDSLKIQIKFFSPNSEIVSDIRKETSTSFGFYSPITVDEMYLTYPHLIVSWQPYLNAIQSRNFYNAGLGWVPIVKAFYATAIIADIRILE